MKNLFEPTDVAFEVAQGVGLGNQALVTVGERAMKRLLGADFHRVDVAALLGEALDVLGAR